MHLSGGELSNGASQHKYQDRQPSLLEAISVGIVELDLDYLVTFSNPAHDRMRGFEPGEALGKPLGHLFNPTCEPPSTMVVENAKCSGGYQWLRLDWSLVHDSAGNLTGYVAAVTDVTDSLGSVQDLQESHDILSAFYDTSPMLMGVVELQGNALLIVSDNHSAKNGIKAANPPRPWTALEIGLSQPAVDYFVEKCRASLTKGVVTSEHASDIRPGRWYRSTVSYIGQQENGNPRFAYVAEDITDQIHQRTVLEENERFLNGIFNGTTEPIVVVDVDPDGVLRYARHNEASRRISGIQHDDLHGKTPEEVLPEIGSFWPDQCRLCANTGEPISFESQYPIGRWWQTTLTPLKDEVGHVYRIISLATEITDRKRAESSLRESEAQFRVIADSAPVMIWLTDADGHCTFLNRAWLELTGRALHQELGRGWSRWMHPNDLPDSLNAYDKALSERAEFQIEFRILDRNGEYRLLRDHGVPRFDASGNFQGHVGYCTDISDSRRAETALRESEERFRLLAENSADVVASHSPEGRYTYLSPSSLLVLGYAPEELIGMSPYELVHPDDLDSLLRFHTKMVERQGVSTLQFRLHCKDGKYRWMESTAVPIRDHEGQIIEIQSAMRDISERKEKIEQTITTQRLEALGRLAGGIAHDFNNLLVGIFGHAELAEREVPSGSTTAEHLREIISNGERAASLTRQLLTFSRHQMTDISTLDLNEIVRGMEKLLRRTLGEDVDLQTMEDADLWPVRTGRGLIEQVLLNLVVNARDAMPLGGRIEIDTQNVVLDDREASRYADLTSGEYVLLAVTDTGPGVPDEIRNRIFDPFFTTKNPGKGTGLGLATGYGVVRQTGGTIAIDSAHHGGARFLVFLPRAFGRPEHKEEPTSREPTHTGSGTVLLVEDEDGVRDVAATVLRRAGLTVLPADDGVAALAILEEHGESVDLLLTDMVMPRMGGQELVDRAQERWPGIKVICCSGHTNVMLPTSSSVEFLQKPFTPSSLIKTVLEALVASTARAA